MQNIVEPTAKMCRQNRNICRWTALPVRQYRP